MVSTSVLVHLHMCEHLKKGGKSRPLRAQQTVLGPSGAPLLDSSLSLAQKAPHLTPLFPGAWWTEPHQGTPLPGPGQGSRALSLSLSSHHKHWWLLTSWEASFPAEERTWQSGHCSHPCRDGPNSYQNVDALHFQTRLLALHSFCLLEHFFMQSFT